MFNLFCLLVGYDVSLSCFVPMFGVWWGLIGRQPVCVVSGWWGRGVLRLMFVFCSCWVRVVVTTGLWVGDGNFLFAMGGGLELRRESVLLIFF